MEAEAEAAVAPTSSKYRLTKIPLKQMKKTCERVIRMTVPSGRLRNTSLGRGHLN